MRVWVLEEAFVAIDEWVVVAVCSSRAIALALAQEEVARYLAMGEGPPSYRLYSTAVDELRFEDPKVRHPELL